MVVIKKTIENLGEISSSMLRSVRNPEWLKILQFKILMGRMRKKISLLDELFVKLKQSFFFINNL